MIVKLELNQQQMAVLSDALQEMPFRLASPLIVEINRQIQEQLKNEKGEN